MPTYTFSDALYDVLSVQIPVILVMFFLHTFSMVYHLPVSFWSYCTYSLFSTFIWYCVVLMCFMLDVIAVGAVFAMKQTWDGCIASVQKPRTQG